MLLAMHYAALRVSEVAQLRISNVLNADGTLKDELRFNAAQVKENRDGTVPISPKLKQELSVYLASIDVTNTDAALFPSERSEFYSANSLRQVVNGMYKQAGIVGATSHSGRRTAITKLANAGVTVRQLQALARHASVTTTQRYIDVNDEQLRNAVALL